MKAGDLDIELFVELVRNCIRAELAAFRAEEWTQEKSDEAGRLIVKELRLKLSTEPRKKSSPSPSR